MAGPETPAPKPQTAVELSARLQAERVGQPFLLFRDLGGVQQIFTLAPSAERITVGRNADNDLALPWDPEVSRVHAELMRLGAEWVISDHGISRNGTFLNGTLVGTQRRRLADGDVLRVGRTLLSVTVPPAAGPETTLRAVTTHNSVELTAMQRRILSALCRPLVTGSPGAMPATNQEIADAVHLSVQGVKSQLRTLTERYGYADLPQNRKRLALAERAVRFGLGGTAD